jgi:eukaryotic-like serine/threonine-protein kinase
MPPPSDPSPSNARTTPTGIDDLVDRMLGDFRLIRRLGKGGMAEVYLAEQTSLKRQVAVKILRQEVQGDADLSLKRFKAEALAAANLNHPNIVQVYMIGEQEGIHYIAQEFVQGVNLKEFLNRKGPPDSQLALHLMKQVVQALGVAEKAGIVHRDIKPENIMMTRKAEVKVADFGLAQLTMGGQRLNLTQSGMTMGTPLYMSPEQVSGQPVDHRSDLYSLGVTFYHLLSGVPPFRGETALSVAVQHLREKAPLLQEARPDLPAGLCDLIHQLMAKTPDERPASAALVLKDIKRIGSPKPAGDDSAPANNPSLNLSVAAVLADVEDEVTKVQSLKPETQVSRTMQTVIAHADRRMSEHLVPMIVATLLAGAAAAAVGWVSRPKFSLPTVSPANDEAAARSVPAS